MKNLNKIKIKQMINFKKNFYSDFGLEIELKQTDKIFHYFEIYDGSLKKTKIVHKKSLQEIYGYDGSDLFEFFRSNNELLPQLLKETDNFFIFEFLEGEILTSITSEDFNYLERFENEEFYPFINSLYYNLIRLEDGKIKLIDLKHLDNKICNIPEHLKQNLIVFLYNIDNKISNLYIRKEKYLDEILNILEKDYDNIKVINV